MVILNPCAIGDCAVIEMECRTCSGWAGSDPDRALWFRPAGQGYIDPLRFGFGCCVGHGDVDLILANYERH
jgi:hypothetical protein